MKKLTKAQVKAIAKKTGSVTVWLCPSKSFPEPNNPFSVAIEKRFTDRDVLSDSLETFLNTFAYYNCDKETGKTIHYYLNEA